MARISLRGRRNRGPFAVCRNRPGTQPGDGKPGIDRSPVSLALRRRVRSDAQSQRPSAKGARIRECLCGLPGEHQGAVLGSVFYVSRFRQRAGRVCEFTVPLGGFGSRRRRLSHGHVPLGTVRVSGDGLDYPPPRLPDAGRCRRHRRQPQFELWR